MSRRGLSVAPSDSLEQLLEGVRAVGSAALELGPIERAKVCGALAEVQARLLLTPAAGLDPDRPVSPPETPRLLTAQEAGARLGKSKWWVYRNRATLPHLVVGDEYRFPSEKLDRWAESRTRLV